MRVGPLSLQAWNGGELYVLVWSIGFESPRHVGSSSLRMGMAVAGQAVGSAAAEGHFHAFLPGPRNSGVALLRKPG